MRSLNITEARQRLLGISKELQERPSEVVCVTRNDAPALALMSWDLCEAITETLDILGDKEAMAELERGLAAVAEGHTLSLEEARSRLGL